MNMVCGYHEYGMWPPPFLHGARVLHAVPPMGAPEWDSGM